MFLIVPLVVLHMVTIGQNFPPDIAEDFRSTLSCHFFFMFTHLDGENYSAYRGLLRGGLGSCNGEIPAGV